MGGWMTAFQTPKSRAQPVVSIRRNDAQHLVSQWIQAINDRMKEEAYRVEGREGRRMGKAEARKRGAGTTASPAAAERLSDCL